MYQLATYPLFEQLAPDHSKNENDLGGRFELKGNVAQRRDDSRTTMPNALSTCSNIIPNFHRSPSFLDEQRLQRRAQNRQEHRASLRGGGIVADASAIRKRVDYARTEKLSKCYACGQRHYLPLP